MINFDNIPNYLQSLDHWALYTKRKIPIQVGAIAKGWPTVSAAEIGGKVGAQSNNAQTWATFDDCRKIYDRCATGSNGIIVGPTFSLGDNNGHDAEIVVIDIDDPVRAIEGKIGVDGKPLPEETKKYLIAEARKSQAEILYGFNGHYIERSVSGSGYHIFVRGHLPAGWERCRLSFWGSVFGVGQFINMTGNLLGRTGDDSVTALPFIVNNVRVVSGTDVLTDDNGMLTRFVEFYGSSDVGLLVPIGRDIDPKSLEGGEDDIGDVGSLDLPYEKYGRRLDLKDFEVVGKLSKGMQACLAGGSITGDHSGDTMSLLGDLEKISGDADQIRRILFDSARMRGAGVGNDGNSRWDKHWNGFERNLLKKRAENDKLAAKREAAGTLISPERREEMRSAFDRLASANDPGSIAYKAAKAAREREEQESEARRLHDVQIEYIKNERDKRRSKGFRYTKFSQDAITLLSCGVHEAYVNDELLPPGRMGEYCRYAYEGMRAPFMKFAIPATFAAIAGIVARKYKTPFDQDGLNLMFVALGQTGVGKTQSIESWTNFMAELSRETHFKRRYLHLPVGSRQGMHKELEKAPCMTWVVDECATQLQQIIAPRFGDTNAELLQGFANQIFDIGRHDRDFRAMASVRSEHDKDNPIPNLCVSTFWGTTQSNARQFFTKEAVKSGIVSRIIFVNHGTSGGIARGYGEERLLALPQGDAREVIKTLIALADQLDKLYAIASPSINPDIFKGMTSAEAAEKHADIENKRTAALKELRNQIVIVKFDEVALELAKAVFKQSDIFMRGIHDDTAHSLFPDYYLALNRLGPITVRMASLMAVVDNPNNPVIYYDHVAWALGYVLQASCGVLSALDTNDLGIDFDDAEMTVVKIMRAMSLEPEGVAQGYVSYGDLIRRLVRNAPFNGHIRGARTEAKRCLDDMIEHEQISCMDYSPTDERGNLIRRTGPRPRHLTMNDHPIWKT